MPWFQAALLALAVVALVILGDRLKLAAFLAVLVATFGYGLFSWMSLDYVLSSIAMGFAQALDSVGLVIVAGAIVAAVVERSGIVDSARSRRALPRWLAVPALIAGTVASATSALALILPVLAAWCRAAGLAGGPATIAVALLLAAGHGVLLPAPGPVAAVAILGAEVRPTLLIGVPVAIVMGLVGWMIAARFATANVSPPRMPATRPRAGRLALILPVLVPIVFLILQSVAQIPSEPLGRGPTRELMIGMGRGAFILLVSVVLVLLLTRRWDAEALSERGWMGDAAASAAGLLLVVGATGGFAKLLQNTGMSELLGESASTLSLGVLAPLLVALIVKTLQGSSLVAAITTAGMIESLLPAIGLDGTTGRALAVVAIGAGSSAASHVNDATFWIVGRASGMSHGRTLLLYSGGGLLQCAAAAALLSGISAVVR